MITLHCRPPGERATEVRIGAGAQDDLARGAAGRQGFVLLDEAAAAALPPALPTEWTVHRVRGGEQLKTLAQAEAVLRAMVQAGCDRRSVLWAIGGGATGDLGGLCAALFARGIELWHTPTTMLAMVDSSVGGKNAVNLPEGKNLVGTVHAATRVAIDARCAASESETGYRSGLAESIKMAIGLDADLFARLERDHDRIARRAPDAVHDVVQRSLAAKIAVVEADLLETGRRRLLNLGHTLGHALEAADGGRTPHGLCVARGLWFALAVARELGSIAPADLARCEALLTRYGHARTPLPERAALEPFLARDKKVEGGAVHFALPTGIGSSEVRAIPLARLRELLAVG